MKKKPVILLFVVVCICIAGFLWSQLMRSNTGEIGKRTYIYVPTGSGYPELLQQVKDSQVVRSVSSFEWAAKRMKLAGQIRPGRYEIEAGMGNYAIISMLKAGRQKPVRLVINKLRTKQDIVRKLAANLEADSLTLTRLLNDSVYLAKWNITSEQVQCLVMPATYELYWNTPAEKVISKIARTHEQFWNAERRKMAGRLSLSIPQVITLASIVEEETNQDEEKPKVAGVYLNRYRIGMKLGADPTVKFAVGDFALRRILNKHTQFPSPYNTYLNAGIPPGPICTPSSKSIEAVLNPDPAPNLFFCAKEDFSGFHNFARTYNEHLANARRYQQALDQRGIR